ncbi:MAG TPA: 23S rRNA (uracil(1939)-C(5))-methyltransferase RlmD [Gammaproteobacteria bacterium]|nr:23S rRNA (uracil(1939)-C(5))-methyltransferase RlmD [Gammaproteobacteria bacterium]
MARRRRVPLPAPVEADIDSLAHDGRGVAHVEGKAVFIDGALPGERVRFAYLRQHRSYDEGRTVDVLAAAPERVEPRCPHFGVCGGCTLQHMAPPAQILAKQGILLENLTRIGDVRPQNVLEPLTGPHWGYRHKARLGAKFVVKKGRMLVGFRERHAPYVAELTRCEVLHPSVGERIAALTELLAGLSVRMRVPQVEVAVGDRITALVFRHLDPLTDADRSALEAFGRTHDFAVYLQPGGPASVELLYPQAAELTYGLPAHHVTLAFEPTDFIQINPAINRQMVDRVLELLALRPEHQVLDLFCGLGNFTLPMARQAAGVVGVEGEAGLVRRAEQNAARNGIANARFYCADLNEDLVDSPWLQRRYDRILLDPPRSGAAAMMARVAALEAPRIVYVSCHPGSLARDAGQLVHELGYRLVSAGVMDMFPHTAHVESIALFERPA